MEDWAVKIFETSARRFNSLVFELFRFQYQHNALYRQYADYLDKTPDNCSTIENIPFLPIRFFKSHIVQSTAFQPATIFESSGTTSSVNSRHHVKDVSLYEQGFMNGFNRFYGNIKDWCIIGLLPSYLERGGSSLVYMVDKLIAASDHTKSGFYLNEFEKLSHTLSELNKTKQPTLLIGVTYALLDFAEQYPQALPNITIMETGGMKGRRQEMIRAEVHEKLKDAFKVSAIHSEYGMTELLSQAYSKSCGLFECPSWMKVMVRDEEDPLAISATGKGVLNVIDLANVYSCGFIATDDVGKIDSHNQFEVLGRLDGSDLRGCSLLAL